MSRQFWKDVWAELNGSADRRRVAEAIGTAITDQTLRIHPSTTVATAMRFST